MVKQDTNMMILIELLYINRIKELTQRYLFCYTDTYITVTIIYKLLVTDKGLNYNLQTQGGLC